MAILVEYEFVTTAPRERAMPEAVRFVRSLGFAADRHDGASFVARRGSPTPGWGAPLDDLPQSIGLTFDRGRVRLAVCLATPGKAHAIHRHRVLLITQMIEAAMRPDRSLHAVVPRWNVHRLDSIEFRRKQQSKQAIKWVALGGTIFLVLFAIIVAGVVLEG